MNGSPTDRLGVERFADKPPRPWNNGHGSTRELARRLLGVVGPDFVWRISVAEVTEEVELSTFHGVRRTVMPVHGGRLTLDVDGQHHVVQPFESFAFDAEARVFARPEDAPVQILNVMTKAARMVAQLDVVDLAEGSHSIAGATSWVQLTGSASVHTTDDRQADLAPLDTLVPRPRVRVLHGTGLGAVVRMTNYRAYHATA